METAIVLLESRVSVETPKELGVRAGSESGPTVDNGHRRKPHTQRARELYHKLVSHFRIGYDYDWEEQYKEYDEYWKNYFNGPKVH